MITAEQLRQIMPRADAAAWTDVLNAAMAEREINTPLRVATFIAHVAVESGELHTLVENLNYAAARLTKVWPARFPNLAAAEPFAANPEKLANSVYGGRLGNGPPQSGDGFRYRGRGLLQATGRDHYRQASDALGIDLVASPELLEEPILAAREAAWWWQKRKLNAIADRQNFRHSSYVINGGFTAFDERIAFWRTAIAVLGADTDGVDRGEAAYQTQRALNARGADPKLAEDGDWGPRSEQAAEAFRAKRGVAPGLGIDATLLAALGLDKIAASATA